MKNLSRISLVVVFILITVALVTIFTKVTEAHPGNTDYQGCHTCSTNCPSWGLYYGEYHCHTPKYTTPTCPIFSSYSSISDSCECNYGYVASGSQCISENQYCQNLYGYNSKYDSLSDNCECSYGYVFDSSGKCVSGNTSCWNKYGYNSQYDNLDNTCECNYGYVFDQSGNKCISEDESCKELYGYGSKSTLSGNKCECRDGYEWEGNRCVLESIYSEPIYIPEKVNTPLPKVQTLTKNVTVESSPTSTNYPVETTYPILITNKDNGLFIQIWNFIKKFIGL